MENTFLHIQGPVVPGMTEIYDVIYDKNVISFDEFIYLEHVAMLAAIYSKWKIFKSFPTKLGPLMFCKN